MSLVISRKVDQGFRLYDANGLFIGRVVVIGIERDRAKLAIQADARFTILRDELVKDVAS